MDSKIIRKLLILISLFFSTHLYAIEFEGKFIQGHFILGKTSPKSKILIDNVEVKVSKDGFFAFGISRDRKNDIIITKIENNNKKEIVKKNF